MAAVEIPASRNIHDCNNANADSGSLDRAAGLTDDNRADCADCFDISKADESLRSVALPGTERDLEPDPDVAAIDIAARSESTDRGSASASAD